MSITHHFTRLIPAAAIALALTSCSCNSDSSSDAADSASRTIAPADSSSYFLGRSEALQLLDCRSKNEVCDRLLDLRAREHIIRTQMSQSSADAYIYGIEDAIRESGDTLINVITPDPSH